MESGVQATWIAALVWGRDEDGGGLTFEQKDIAGIMVAADPFSEWAAMTIQTGLFPLLDDFGKAFLSLCISDKNRVLLLTEAHTIPLLVSMLLLDSDHDHPRRIEANFDNVKDDFDNVKGPVQRDIAECFQQLAACPAGREVLMQDPTVR